jgi:Nucleotidyl transferase AbiEii toxin, Type IV TA system
MNATFKACMQILPQGQQRLWPELASVTAAGFVLYGGTAIALRLGHRTSVDFDFFSEQALDRELIGAIAPFVGRGNVIQDERNTLSVLIPVAEEDATQVKVSFFGTIGFGRVGEPAFTEDGVLQVASMEDLLATKLKVILQRAEAKDYRDIAAIIGSGANLLAGLAAARELFGKTFQPSESLKALTFFADGDLSTLTNREKTVLIHAASTVRELPPVSIRSYGLAAQATSSPTMAMDRSLKSKK